MRDIDHTVIQKYSIWDGGESHPWGLGFILPDQEETEEEEEEDEDVPDLQIVGAPPDYYARKEREMCRLQRKMDAMHANFQAFTVDFSGALSQAFSQQGI